MESQDRRSHRIQLALIVEIAYLMGNSHMKQMATTVNISADGALLACGQTITTGHDVQLRIHCPGGSLFPALAMGNKTLGNEVVFSLSAHVVRFEEDPENEGDYLAAVSFFGSGRVESKQGILQGNEKSANGF